MAIKTVAELTEVTGAAVIVANEEVFEGLFHKSEDGEVSIQFEDVPSGPITLTLDDGLKSQYPGFFRGGEFTPAS